jgi:hypothetical protein
MTVRAEDTKAEECNDLVIRAGFPALLLPGGQRPNIDSDECLPRHAIWACDTALTFADRDALIADCETVFTARARENDTNYSAGTTYFLPFQMYWTPLLLNLNNPVLNGGRLSWTTT